MFGLISFKFGPISAFDPASASVWQVEQTALFKKTSLPKSNLSSACTGRKKKINRKNNYKKVKIIYSHYFVIATYFFLKLEKNFLTKAAPIPNTIARIIETIPY